MSDFITISCPSCGGQLKRGANTTTYTCDYCGQQHRLRVEDIEEFGRCPVCHRNDRVEIVRAIYNKGGNLAARLAPPADPLKSLTYGPPPKPAPPGKPANKRIRSKSTTIGFVLLTLTLIFGSVFCCGSLYKDSPALDFLIVFLGVLLVVTIIFLIKGANDTHWLNKEQEELIEADLATQNQESLKRWATDKDSYNTTYQKKTVQLVKDHKKTMQRYDSIYYCHRDDCVFIPGESGHAPSAQLQGFLHSEDIEA